MNKEGTVKLLIGLEIHVTLSSQKKIFNLEDTYQEEIAPNSRVGPWELGYLGTLPIINPEVIELALKLAAALRMKINPMILFDRKIYHYFDLPKGYQITQYHQPLASSGYLPLITEKNIKNIPLRNLQLEEDTAKSFYTKKGIELDFNRSGNPLIELTTDPVFCKVEEVISFLKQLQTLLQYLDISEARMEKGQLRVDLNFSLDLGSHYQTPRYEAKNLNSLSNLEKVLQFEIDKHLDLFKRKISPPASQTLGFDEKKQITFVQREKTNYFYLPEVNIPHIKVKKKEIKKVINDLPFLPWEWWEKFSKNNMNPKQIELVIEKPLLMKIFTFLEKKKKFSFVEANDWLIFLSNYLIPYFDQEGNSIQKQFSLFRSRWLTYFRLFQLWKKKEFDKGEISRITKKLFTTCYRLSSLIKQHKKRRAIIDVELVERFLSEIWNEEKLTKEDCLARSQKIQNYLLGRLRRQFSRNSAQELVKVIEKFIRKMTL